MPYIGNIVQDFSVNTAMLNTDSVTSIKIDDGTIVNADINDSAAIAMSKLALSITNSEINASAAIAGTKISPNFGSQNTTTTGIAAVGELQVTSTAPKITFFDSDTNPDFEIRNLNGVLHFKDVSSTAVRMQINTDGHVDILGNLDVGAGLDVTGAITLQTNNPNIRFDDSDSNNNGEITLDNTQLRIEVDEDQAVDNSAIKFRIDNSDKAIIDTSGNVGIGTTSPDAQLEVSSSSFSTEIKISTSDQQDAVGNVHGQLVFEGRNQAGTVYESAQIQSICESSIGTRRAGLGFLTSGSTPGVLTEKLRITHDGSVGIGTASPAGKLHISSGTSGDCELIIEADTDNNDENDNARIVFRQDGGSAQSSIGTQSNELVLANSVSTSGGIVFKTGTTSPHTNALERMRIHSGTNQVQIGGTTLINSDPYLTLGQSANSQGNVLHMVNNGTADLKMSFISAGKNSRAIGIDVSTDNFFIGRDSSDIDLTITNSGKVGIGVLSPTSTLQVGGDIRTTNRLGVGTAANFANIVSYVTGTGSYPPSGGLVQANNADSTAMFWNASNSANYTGLSIECRTTGAAYWMLANVYNSSFNGDLAFRTRTGGSSNDERVRFLRGGGITFNGDTSSDNALDDYEEGNLNWQLRKHNTPSLGTDNGSVVKYTKVGRLVHISGRIRTDSTGSAATDNFLLVGTLPFTPATAGTNPIGHWRSQDDLGINGSFAWVGGSTTVYIYKQTAQNDYAADENNVGAKTQTNLVVTFSLTYQSV